MQLEIRNLSSTYANGVQALEGVSLTVPPGLYALVGPHGAGKSTLLRILAALQPADRGSVRLGAIDVLRQPDEIRKSLGYLSQEPGALPAVIAEDLLGHFALLRGMVRHWQRREAVEVLLRRVGLWEVRRQSLGGYSGALRMRFRLAAALLGNPQLLLLDEPSSGLDPSERLCLLELLRNLGEDRIVLLATRALDDLGDMCTHTTMIDRGRIVREDEGAARRPAARRLRG